MTPVRLITLVLAVGLLVAQVYYRLGLTAVQWLVLLGTLALAPLGELRHRNLGLFALVAFLFVATGILQSWNLSLNILNLALLSCIMAIGVNIQWGYAGLFSTGIVGSVALGGLAVVLISSKPVPEGWAAGGPRIVEALLFATLAIALAVWFFRKLKPGTNRALALAIYLVIAFFIYRLILDPGVIAVEANTPIESPSPRPHRSFHWRPRLTHSISRRADP